MAKVTYNFDLSEFLEKKGAKGKKREIKKAVGDFLVSAVIDDMNNSTSSVTGRKFRKLDKEYVKDKLKKGGSSNPDLELFGNLKESIEFKQKSDSVEVGVFGGVNALKAETHNLGTQKDRGVPQRQFLPIGSEEGNKGQFRPQIRKEIVKIIEEIIGDDKVQDN